MTRFGACAILTFTAALAGLSQADRMQAGGDKARDQYQFQGKLAKGDPADPQRRGPSKTYIVPLKAGTAYTMDLVSSDFDSYLRLLDSRDTQLEEDDDSGGGLNSRIIFNCQSDGNYKLVCTTYGPNMAGSYTLTVKSSAALAQPSTAHARLLGAPAPDFQADFALNGKAVNLADLRGKVVLLDFWEVRSSPCAASLPRLSEWHKIYHKEGLAIVGLTFYPSDIHQTLGFDRMEGKVITAGSGDRKSDRALLHAFAAHHKVEHVLLALSKQEALDAFDAYAVNGVPQMVLIDRKGMVRRIEVAGAKSHPALESEIKKLLAEK